MYTRDFYELDKILAQLRNVIDPQLIEIRTINNQLNEAFSRYLPELDWLKKISNDLQPYIKIKELTSPLREILDKLPPMEFLNFPAHNAIQNYISTVNYQNYDSFINAIAFEIDTAFLSYNEKQKALLIKKVLKYFIQKINSLSPSYLNYQGIKQNLLSIVAILLTLFQIYQSDISTQEIKDSDREQLANIQEVLEKVEEIKAEEDINKIYIAKSKVNVRVEPTKAAPKLCLLYPNQEVKLVDKKNNWYYIEFFDYINAIPRMGYVYKKYLMPKKNAVVEKDRHKVLVRHKRTLEEASLNVRRYLKRNLSDKEIDQLVRKVRKELWGE